MLHAKNSFVNDDFAEPAVGFLRKYLTPGSKCVYFGQSNVGGTLMTEFRDISVVSVVSDKWFQWRCVCHVMGRKNVNAVRRKERRPNWHEEVRLPS